MSPIETIRRFVSSPDDLSQELVLTHAEASAIVSELDRLQRLAGAVSTGESFGEIRDATKKPSA